MQFVCNFRELPWCGETAINCAEMTAMTEITHIKLRKHVSSVQWVCVIQRPSTNNKQPVDQCNGTQGTGCVYTALNDATFCLLVVKTSSLGTRRVGRFHARWFSNTANNIRCEDFFAILEITCFHSKTSSVGMIKNQKFFGFVFILLYEQSIICAINRS